MTAPEIPLADRIVGTLAPYLGPSSATAWVRAVAKKQLGLALEELRPEHLEALLEGLGPSLRTLMGRAAAEELTARIASEVSR